MEIWSLCLKKHFLARISFTNSMSNRLSALFGILENVFKEATPEQLDYLRKLADVKDGDNSTVKKAVEPGNNYWFTAVC